jgi:hypothetical protein
VPEGDEDIEAIAEAVRKDEDGYTPPEEMTAEPAPVTAMNLAARISLMTTSQKLKLALRGNRETRTILIRDTSVMVQRFLVENPRLTDDEIVSIAKSRTIVSEVLAKIARNREWMRNYLVRHALVNNPRTPIGISIGLVSTLQERDLRTLAKSHSVQSAVAATARRILMGKV